MARGAVVGRRGTAAQSYSSLASSYHREQPWVQNQPAVLGAGIRCSSCVASETVGCRAGDLILHRAQLAAAAAAVASECHSPGQTTVSWG